MKININAQIETEMKEMEVRKKNLEKAMILLREGAYTEDGVLHIRTCPGCLAGQLSREATHANSKPSEYLKLLLEFLAVKKLLIHGLVDYKDFEHVDAAEYFGCDTAFYCDGIETVCDR